jgi:hypothetical protein
MSATTPLATATVLAREPCAGCGAPLGADQRYCLSCGIPRASTRLPFLDVLAAEASSAAAGGLQPAPYLRAPAVGPGAGGAGWGGAGGGGWGGDGSRGALARSTGPLALTSAVLLALLVGLVVGHWVSGTQGNAKGTLTPTQVIKYEGIPAAAAVAAPTAPAQVATGVPAGAAAGTATSAAGGGAAATPSTGATPPTGATPTTGAVTHATNPTLQQLQKSTGKAHAKQVNKLVDKGQPISTGGAPPPKDNKPAGDGSGFQTIGG